jgi:hypothetical protein
VNNLGTFTCTNVPWTQHVLDLGAFANQTIYIAFHQTFSQATNWGFGIDDVLVRALYPDNDFLSFAFPQQTLPGVIDTENLTVTIEVVVGTDPSALVANFTVSPGATAFVEDPATSEYIRQISGETANDFSAGSLVYIIEAENGNQVSWEVIVSVATTQSSEKEILTYSFPQQTGVPVIDAVNHTIVAEVAYPATTASLIASFTLSPMATAWIDNGVTRVLVQQTSGVTANNFSSPVTYIIRAEDGSEQAWVVTVSATDPPLGDTIANPYVIPALPYSATGSTVGFYHDYGLYGDPAGLINLVNPNISYYATSTLGGPDVVYQLVLAEPTLLYIDLYGSTYDTAVALVKAPGTNPEDVYLIDDDAYGSPSWVSYVDSGSNYVPAGTYYIVIGSYGNYSGYYELYVGSVTPPQTPVVTIGTGASPGDVVLYWTENAGMTYDIYSSTDPNGPFNTIVAEGVTGDFYTIAGPAADKNFYVVRESFSFPTALRGSLTPKLQNPAK